VEACCPDQPQKRVVKRVREAETRSLDSRFFKKNSQKGLGHRFVSEKGGLGTEKSQMSRGRRAKNNRIAGGLL